jgi:glycerol-3-phosphate acyltransferase PlsX
MGSALVGAIDGRQQPTVGLLNVGEELTKGNDTVKLAAELLRDAQAKGQISFFGNVEGNDIYRGITDVVVCDGFVGNVALKASEGLAQLMTGFIREEFERTPLSKVLALMAFPVLKRFKRRLDPRRYNGASLVGLRGVVIKSHGSADAVAFGNALGRARDAARNGLVDRIASVLG